MTICEDLQVENCAKHTGGSVARNFTWFLTVDKFSSCISQMHHLGRVYSMPSQGYQGNSLNIEIIRGMSGKLFVFFSLAD